MLNYRLIKGKNQQKTILFLHGFLESLTMWDYLNCQDFPFNSLLVDLPGHGNSIIEDVNSPSINYFADSVKETIELLNIHLDGVVGHSMGGYVALNLKKIHFNSIPIVLLNSNFWEDPLPKKKDRIRVAEIVLKNKVLFLKEAIPNLFLRKNEFEREISNLLEESFKMEAASISYASLAMREREDYSIFLQDYDDVHVIQGAQDKIVTKEDMDLKINNLKLPYYIVSEVGHMSHIEKSDEVKQILKEVFF
jgi:pimeloyl-ACP methyl ester carboxylesterase